NTREKALDGLSIALQGLQVPPPEGWAALRTELYAIKNNRITNHLERIGVAFKDPLSFRRLMDVAKTVKRSEAERVDAVRQLSLLKNPDAIKFCLALVREDKSDAVRAEAVRTLGVFPDRDIPQVLVLNWKEFPAPVRTEVVNVLSSRKEWAASLLTAMKEKVIDRALVTDNAITRIQSFKDRGLDELIEEVWGKVRSTPEDLQKVIDDMRKDLAAGSGSYSRGQAVFANQCAKCHQFEGKGAGVGPALDGAGRDIEYLLANILDPNRVIGAPYFVRQVNLTDGQLLQGVLVEEDERFLSLKLEQGVVKKIPKADIDGAVKILEKSMMPEGLGYNMTKQDFRDLVRYVMANPYLTTWEADGKQLPVGIPGEVVVAAGRWELKTKVTAPGSVPTRVMVTATTGFEVRLDGKLLGKVAGTKTGEPDAESFPVTLTSGDHTLTVSRADGTAGFLKVRFADPDRKLRYVEPGQSR
ncbi:MAG: c-type cytochrome, partial [Gemmataceae bacterium]